MSRKLLNSVKNLIIVITLVVVFIMLLSTSVFAASNNETIDVIMRQKISGWYMAIRGVSLAVMLVLLLIVGLKLMVFTVSSADKALFKRILVDWLIGFILLFFIYYIMYAVILLNENTVNRMKSWGYELSGLSSEGDNEYDLYEYAMSKAYEIKFTSGTIGMIMYIMLVVYSYKFVIIYAKRYINVIVLILIGPVVCVITAFKRVLSGKSGDVLKKWIKEFLYNVLIQSLHALFYASLVGTTLRMSDETESTIGALLTLIIFAFIFKLDGIVRKIFNFVGGKNTITEYSLTDTAKNVKGLANKVQSGELKDSLNSKFQSKIDYFENTDTEKIMADVGNKMIKFKNDAVGKAKNTLNSLDGKNVKVTKEEIAKEQEKIDNPNDIQKVLNTVQGIAFAAYGKGLKLTAKQIDKFKKLLEKEIEKTKNNMSLLKEGIDSINYLKNYLRNLKNNNYYLRNNEELMNINEEFLGDAYKTVIDEDKRPQVIFDELRDALDRCSNIMDALYEVEGPKAFLYPKVGSPLLGMQVLAYQNYVKQFMNSDIMKVASNGVLLEYNNVGDVLGIAKFMVKEDETPQETMAFITKKSLNIDQLEEANETVETTPDILGMDYLNIALNNFIPGNTINIKKISTYKKFGKNKKYKFKRFNVQSTKTIISVLNTRYVMNNAWLRRMNEISKEIDLGTINVKDVSEIKTGTKIIYKGKLNKSRKIALEHQIVLQRYKQRVQDGRWAQLLSISEDMTSKLNKKRNELSDNLLAIHQLQFMGKAIPMNKKVVVFGQMASNSLGVNNSASEVNFAINNRIITKGQYIQSMLQENNIVVQAIFDFIPDKAVVNIYSSQLMTENENIINLKKVGLIKNEEIIQYVVNEKGEIVEQRLDINGQIITPAEDENGSILSVFSDDKIFVQHIVSFDGEIVKQTISTDESGNLSLVVNETNDNVSNQYNVDTILEEVHKLVYEEVSDNLYTQVDFGEVTADFADLVKSVNDIAIEEASNENEIEKLNQMDDLINKITPEVPKGEQVLEYITDSIIVNTAIEKGEYNLELDNQAKEEVLDRLVESGVVSDDVHSNQQLKNEVLGSIKQRADNIDESVVLESLVQQEISKLLQNTSSNNKDATSTNQQGLVNNIFSSNNTSAEKNQVSIQGSFSRLDSVIQTVSGQNENKTQIEVNSINNNRNLTSNISDFSNNIDSNNQLNKNKFEDISEKSTADVVLEQVLEYIADTAKDKVQKKVSEDKQKVEEFVERETKNAKKVIKQLTDVDFQDDSEQYGKDDMFIVFISGAVKNPGKVQVKIGTRIRNAVAKVGIIEGVTDWDGLDRWLNENYNMNIDSPIGNDMMTIWVPTKRESFDEDDENTEVNKEENDINKYKKTIEKIIIEYMRKNKISEPETLKRLVHKNMIISQIQKEIKDDNITRNEISKYFEKFIKQTRKIKDALERVTSSIQVVSTNEIKPDKVDIQQEKNREEKATINNLLSEVVNDDLKKLIEQIKSNEDKVLAGSAQQNARKKYLEMDLNAMLRNMMNN